MKYEVQLENYAPRFATVIVFADSLEEAERNAMQMDFDGLVTWDTPEFSCYSGTATEVEDYLSVTDPDEIVAIGSFYKFVNKAINTNEN